MGSVSRGTGGEEKWREERERERVTARERDWTGGKKRKGRKEGSAEEKERDLGLELKMPFFG